VLARIAITLDAMCQPILLNNFEYSRSRCLFLLCLERLFAVAPNHDNRQETAHDSCEKDDEDNGDADGPNTREEERVKWVILVDEGLGCY